MSVLVAAGKCYTRPVLIDVSNLKSNVRKLAFHALSLSTTNLKDNI